MIKPVKPRKPTKPKLKEPTRELVDRLYLYHATIYRNNVPSGPPQTAESSYCFIKDDAVPVCDDEDDPYYEHYKVESIELPKLLELFEENNIDPAKVTIENERYYRKSDGQLVMAVSRSLSDTDYQNWVDGNRDSMLQYNTDKDAYPALLETYKSQKKLWDIHQAELKLRELRGN